MICGNALVATRPSVLRALLGTARKSGISLMLSALWLCASASQIAAQTFTTVFSFNGSNGGNPVGVVQGTDGNLYGITGHPDGTIFKITPSGTLTTLFTFNGLSDNGAEFPAAGLVQGSDGNFYGTTAFGGANGDGTVFSLSVAPN